MLVSNTILRRLAIAPRCCFHRRCGRRQTFLACSTHADTFAPNDLQAFVQKNCIDCHSPDNSEGDLNLSELSSKPLEGQHLAIWTKVHDRVAAGEMPPKSELTAEQKEAFTKDLFDRLVDLDRRELASTGRAVWRRMNRYEYENTLRDLLGAPWLQIKGTLPEDGRTETIQQDR